MQVRKNTKIFKSIQEIIDKCKDRPDREKLIRLYITKAGHSIKDRISVEGIEGNTALYYNLTYDAVWNNLTSPGRQLHQSDEIPGLYYFNSGQNKAWDETPFEFDEAIKTEFPGTQHMPLLRRKGKVEKFIVPTAQEKSKPAGKKAEKDTVSEKHGLKKTVTDKSKNKGQEKEKGKESAKKLPPVVVKEKSPPQPNYHLNQKIQFTELDKIIFSAPALTKKGVLDYYDKIAEFILPHMKDRPLGIRGISKGRQTETAIITELPESISIPDWIDSDAGLILCNDKTHLMWYVEAGAIEFTRGLSKLNSAEFPDYAILIIESHDSSLDKPLEVARAAKEILAGLKVPSFILSDGRAALHVYIPLEPKTKFETSKSVSEYLCKLIRLKVPGLVALEGTEDNSYGLVTLKFQINERGNKLVSPYSLVTGSSPIVAAPFPWQMIQGAIQPHGFTDETVFKFIKKAGDPFEDLPAKKTNAASMLKRMEENYSFLF